MLVEQFSILDEIVQVHLQIFRPKSLEKVSIKYIFSLQQVSKPYSEQYFSKENLHLQF